MKTSEKQIAVVLAIIVGIGAYLGWKSLTPSTTTKPPMPVSVTYRTSSVGIGYVVQFHNTSNKYLSLRAIFKNSTLNQSMEKQTDLDPFGTQEYGWTDNWKFVSGETITVIENNYQTLNLKIP